MDYALGRAITMDPIPFRLRLGLIGHRDLEEPKPPADAFRKLLEGELFKHLGVEKSKARITPILLAAVTNLADGADRVLAKVVMEQADATLEVILPFETALFRETLKGDENKREFDTMLGMDRAPRVLRLDNQPKDETARSLAYRDAANELLNNCDVVVAIWNDEPPKGPGGTAETIAFARQRRRPLFIISLKGDYRYEPGNGLDHSPIEGLEKYNRRAAPDPSLLSFPGNSELLLLDPAENWAVPTVHQNATTSTLVPAWVRASLLARSNQRKYLWAGGLIHTFAPFAVMCVAIAAVMRTNEEVWFICEAFSLVIILLAFLIGEQGNFQETWMTNRFLAERLRAGFYLASSGLDPVPIDVPPHLGLAHRPGDWPVRAFNEIWRRMPVLTRCEGEGCGNLAEYVRKHWIQGQIKFHESRKERYGSRSRGYQWLSLICFFLTLLIALTHVFFHPEKEIGEIMTVFAITLPAVGGALAAYRTHRGYERLEKRGEQMVDSLTDLDHSFATVRTASQLQQRMREMEMLSLRETQDWLMLQRFAHLEPA